jgi:hypothetical protein
MRVRVAVQIRGQITNANLEAVPLTDYTASFYQEPCEAVGFFDVSGQIAATITELHTNASLTNNDVGVLLNQLDLYNFNDRFSSLSLSLSLFVIEVCVCVCVCAASLDVWRR